jgi:hypothetical protein
VEKLEKEVIGFLIDFTLNIWNDRNSVVHGTKIQHSKLELIAYVHHAVRKEYALFTTEQDPFIEDHFDKTVTERLQDTLKALRYWLKRVEASKVRQSLIRDAKKKIRQIQAENRYIDTEEILTKSNRDLSKWITRKFIPTEESQTTLDRFF